jgi:hypothetical protein
MKLPDTLESETADAALRAEKLSINAHKRFRGLGHASASIVGWVL